MADTREGREKQARDEENRQRQRAVEEARERADEAEPPRTDTDDESEPWRTCRRRGCDAPAEFVVRERYQEETGQGAVEATAALCCQHTAEEHPANLDGSYPDYVFRVDPIETTRGSDGA